MSPYYDRLGYPINDVLEWAKQFEKNDRIVKQTVHNEKGKQFWLSTVFLGTDLGYYPGPPLIFETMAFEIKPEKWNDVVGAMDMSGIYSDRYSTEDQAREGHDPWEVVNPRYMSRGSIKEVIDYVKKEAARGRRDRAEDLRTPNAAWLVTTRCRIAWHHVCVRVKDRVRRQDS